MISSDFIFQYEASKSPEATFALCYEGVQVFLQETVITSKAHIATDLADMMLKMKEPLCRYLKMCVMLYKCEYSEDVISYKEGAREILSFIGKCQRGLYGPGVMQDELTKALVEYIQKDMARSDANESIVTAYSPIVPYVGSTVLKKPMEPNNDAAKRTTVDELLQLIGEPANMLCILRSFSSIMSWTQNGKASYFIMSKQALQPPCIKYIALISAFMAPATETYLYLSPGIGDVSAAVEAIVDALQNVEDSALEDGLDENTNSTVIGAGRLFAGNKEIPTIKDHSYDVHTIISNIIMQRRFRPSRYVSTAMMGLDKIGGIGYYKDYTLVEPQSNEHEGSLSDIVYVPVIDDLNGCNECILKCWKDGSKIEVVTVKGFRQEMYHDMDGDADNEAVDHP